MIHPINYKRTVYQAQSYSKIDLSTGLTYICLVLLPTLVGISSSELRGVFPISPLMLLLIYLPIVSRIVEFVVVSGVSIKLSKSNQILSLLTLALLLSGIMPIIIALETSASTGSLGVLFQILRVSGLILMLYNLFCGKFSNDALKLLIPSLCLIIGADLLIILNLISYFVFGLQSLEHQEIVESTVNNLGTIFNLTPHRLKFFFFPGYNQFGIYSGLVACGAVGILLSAFTSKISRIAKFTLYIVGIISFLLAFLGIICMDTRGAIVNVVAIPTFCLIISYLQQKKLKITNRLSKLICLLLFFIIPLIAPFVILNSDFFSPTQNDLLSSHARKGSDDPFSGRPEIWSAALESTLNSSQETMIFGHGTLDLEKDLSSSRSRILLGVNHAHNTLINHFFELGIFGLSFWIILLYKVSSTLPFLLKKYFNPSILILMGCIQNGTFESFNTLSCFPVYTLFIFSVLNFYSLSSLKECQKKQI